MGLTAILSRMALVLAFVLSASTAFAQIKIVALGDSQIKGKGVAEKDAYPAKLERALKARGHNVVVANAGSNGDTTAGVLNRLDASVPPGTQIVILNAGANDIILFGVSRETVAENRRKIVERLRTRKIEVLTFGVGSGGGIGPPPPGARESLEAMGALTTGGMQGAMFDDPGKHVEKSRKGTEWHLNEAGYDVVVAQTLPMVEELIARTRTGR